MTIRVHNTMTRGKEDLVPRDEGKISIYVCGPTVYGDIHIGNARTFLSFDVIRRYLTYRGFDVTYVQNVTDVDDKIIDRANEEGIPAEEVARKYTRAFLDVMERLGVTPPDDRPKATENIPQMVQMVEQLIKGEHAYVVDGDVYFSVRSFPGYGKLSGRDIDELRSGARVEVDQRKRDPLDFALWKSAKPGEPSWQSPWGPGRPGWHLECSVMSVERLGTAFDIHGGGADLVFPHHENEVAQSEAATGRPFARYWLHGGLLQVNAEKMSKSLGNFLLLKNVLLEHDAPVVRLLMLQTHYRSPLDFSDDRLDEARAAYDRLVNLVRNLRWARAQHSEETGAPAEDREALHQAVCAAREKFEAEMDEDFNTAGALGALFELAKTANTYYSKHQAVLAEADHVALAAAEQEIEELLGVVGVQVHVTEGLDEGYPSEVLSLARTLAGYEGSDADKAVDALLAARAVARSERNWDAADAVRNGLSDLGLLLEDTPQGARVVCQRSRG